MSERKRSRKSSVTTEITDLLKVGKELTRQSDNLQSGLTALLETVAAKEQAIEKATKLLQDKCDSIMERAENDADALRNEAKEEISAWKAEKAKLAHTQQFQPKVKLDVGGVKYTTSLTTLKRFPDTMIGAMFSGRHALPLDEEGYHFIDRDGTHFRYILNYLRSPETFTIELTGASLKELKSECDYYGILDLMFPFKPIASFGATDAHGRHVTLNQDAEGIWKINNSLLHVCIHCSSASYADFMGTRPNHQRIANLKILVESKGGVITSEQPKPSTTCNSCGRTQV